MTDFKTSRQYWQDLAIAKFLFGLDPSLLTRVPVSASIQSSKLVLSNPEARRKYSKRVGDNVPFLTFIYSKVLQTSNGFSISTKSTPLSFSSEQFALYIGWGCYRGCGRGRDSGEVMVIVEIQVIVDSIIINIMAKPIIFLSATGRSLVNQNRYRWWIMIVFFLCFWFWYSFCYYFSLIFLNGLDWSGEFWPFTSSSIFFYWSSSNLCVLFRYTRPWVIDSEVSSHIIGIKNKFVFLELSDNIIWPLLWLV